MNPIKPTMREKKRYICFAAKGSRKEVEKAILSKIKLWIGEKNFALARVKLEQFDNGVGIFSCNHKQYLDVRMAMMLTPEMKVEVFAVSGMIKKAKERVSKWNH